VQSLPQSIGRYQILKRLGAGQMGVLYLGRDPEIGRLVAVKVLKEDAHDEVRQRFLNEAQVGRMIHQNIVVVFDVGQFGDQPFIVMEYVDGAPMEELIRQKRAMPLDMRLRFLEQLCAGLHYAHEAGVFHRDIKPGNLMLDRKHNVKILDFGVAHMDSPGARRLTQTGSVMGTFNYMSPEQVVGQATDYRTDIFSVGSVMYELLSFRQAFPGSLHEGVLQRIQREPHRPLAAVVSGIDPALVGIVDRALQKDREMRYQHLDEMGNDIVTVRMALRTAAEM
jgi:serine/threonine-protein kinase